MEFENEKLHGFGYVKFENIKMKQNEDNKQ